MRKLESYLNQEKVLIYSLSTETKIGSDFSILIRNSTIRTTYIINDKGEIKNKWNTSPNQEHINVLMESMRK